MSIVAKACRWVSLPGEIRKVPVSTSTNSWLANQARSAVTTRPRPSKNRPAAAWTTAAHKGEKDAGLRGIFCRGDAREIAGDKAQDQYGAPGILKPFMLRIP